MSLLPCATFAGPDEPLANIGGGGPAGPNLALSGNLQVDGTISVGGVAGADGSFVIDAFNNQTSLTQNATPAIPNPFNLNLNSNGALSWGSGLSGLVGGILRTAEIDTQTVVTNKLSGNFIINVPAGTVPGQAGDGIIIRFGNKLIQTGRFTWNANDTSRSYNFFTPFQTVFFAPYVFLSSTPTNPGNTPIVANCVNTANSAFLMVATDVNGATIGGAGAVINWLAFGDAPILDEEVPAPE